MLGRAVHRGARHRDLGRVALGGGNRVRDRACRRRRQRRGLYAWWDLVCARPAARGLTNLNIDAMSAWTFSGLRVDSLVRSMWYNPQHSDVGCARTAGNADCRRGRRHCTHRRDRICGPGARVVDDVQSVHRRAVFAHLRRGRCRRRGAHAPDQRPVLHHAIAAGLVGVAVAWCVTNDMVEGAAGVVLYGLGGYARNRPVATLMLSLGPLVVPAVLGPVAAMAAAAACVAGGRRHRARPARVLSGATVGRGLVHRISRGAVAAAGAAWPRRAVLCASLASTSLGAGSGALAAAIAVVLIVIGLPTTLIDTYNAQDIGNRRMGPGFGGR